MLKATLDALAPRAAAALHRRLAWHAAVGRTPTPTLTLTLTPTLTPTLTSTLTPTLAPTLTLTLTLTRHAAVGAHEVATTLGAPSLPQLSRQLADAQASATAGEPVRRAQREPLPLDLSPAPAPSAQLSPSPSPYPYDLPL